MRNETRTHDDDNRHDTISMEGEWPYLRAVTAVGDDLEHLFDYLARIVAETLGDYCLLYTLDGDRNSLRLQSYHHVDPAWLEAWKRHGRPRITHPQVLRRVLRRRNAMAVGPHGSLEPFAAGEDEADTLWLMAAPMITPCGDAVGALVVGRESEEKLRRGDLALVETIARHAATRVETARLRAELEDANERLEDAVELRDQFISTASHDLRSPLSTMQLVVQLLRRKGERAQATDEPLSADELLERVDTLDRQVRRMTRLLDRLLNVARISSSALDLDICEVDMVEVLGDVLDAYSEDTENEDAPEIRVDAPESVVGRWDRERLDQVVSNLVSNAVKYGEGEPIDIEMEDRDGICILSIRDRGVGIPESERERIFERFERLGEGSEEGLGIGLWLVREIVLAFGGDIEIDSVLGEGTTFRVTLPKQRQRARQTRETESTSDAPRRRRTGRPPDVH